MNAVSAVSIGVLAICMAAACGQDVGLEDAAVDTMLDGGGRTVSVTLNDGAVEVAPVPLLGAAVNGERRVSLAVVVAVVTGPALASYQADFVSSDGFMPASSPNCRTLLPVPGDDLAAGTIDVDTGNLAWDAGLGFPGCKSMHGRNRRLVWEWHAHHPEAVTEKLPCVTQTAA